MKYTGKEVEEQFCIPFENVKKEQMSVENTKLMMTLLLMKEEKIPEDLLKEDFLYQLGQKRVDHVFDYDIDQKSLLFLSAICDSPGKMVMYLTYLQY